LNGDQIELRSAQNRATILLKGAEVASWSVSGLETIWKPDPSIWDRSSPILFPVVGWCRDAHIRVRDHAYPMGVHGFAAHQHFRVVEQSNHAVKLLLRDSPETRKYYPFAFELVVSHEIFGSSLCSTLTIRNTGQEVLPFACGLHPGFRWPLGGADREGHAIEFSAREEPVVPVIAPGGLFSEATRPVTMKDRRLDMADDLFAQEALCFLNSRSRSVEYIAPHGVRLRADFVNLPHLALWSKPGAPFICIEAWTSHGDPVGFDGDIFHKPSMIHLESQAESRHSGTFTLKR
jgi:galactose mutarotase-like enzyme